MEKKLILGLDIGTQAIKGILVTVEGEIVGRAELERGPFHPNPGWVEMDVERDWWGAALQVVRRLLGDLRQPVEAIAGVGVSGLVPCLGLLDADGKSLRPAILYSDNRALEELEWVNQRGGLNLTAEAVVPKLVWVQRHEPEHLDRARVVLSAHNYVVYRLTGALSMDYDTAGIMGGVFDPQQKAWRFDLIERLGLPVHIWPKPSPATGVVGKVTAEAARATGLPENIPVIAGSGDTFPTIVGCGAVETGDAMLAFGTTGLLTLTNRPLVESAAGPHFSSDAAEGAVIWGANVLSAGRLVRWFSDQFAAAERSVAARLGTNEFALLEAQAGRIPPGSEGLIVLPHWLGRRTPTPDANLKGSALGWSPSHTSAHLYRAILEAFAYNVRQSFDGLRAQVRRLVATSGGAQSPLWRQIAADVLEMPLEYYAGSGGALGIAFLTAYALGLAKQFNDIKHAWLARPEVTTPQPEAVRLYRRLFPIYCAFDEAVAVPYAQLRKALQEGEY